MPGFLSGPLTGFVDRAKGKGVVSSAWLNQIGRSAAQAAGGGNVGFLGSAAGIGNGADTTADTLYQAIIPANFFDIPGRCLTLQLAGTVALTSATKTINLVWGGGSLSQSIVSYTTTNGGSWQAYIQIVKVGPNQQVGIFQADASGTTASLLGAASAAWAKRLRLTSSNIHASPGSYRTASRPDKSQDLPGCRRRSSKRFTAVTRRIT